MSSTSLYAAIDLGSNSFHYVGCTRGRREHQTLSRIKRKVRLAAGLNGDNTLCRSHGARLAMLAPVRRAFAGYPRRKSAWSPQRRCAWPVNAGEFLEKAQEILGCAVQVISGEEEARLIYQGVAHTTGGADQRLVVDIGGASTNWLPVPARKPPRF